MEHPLFCSTTEELEQSKHPMKEAFRALREEDKSPAELASMYKEEGNYFFGESKKLNVNERRKKGADSKYNKLLRDAHSCYTHALSFLPLDTNGGNHISNSVINRSIHFRCSRR